MNVYEELTDLYNFDQVEEFTPILHKTVYTLNNEKINGYSFTTPAGKEVFCYRTCSNYHDKGQQWGNPWNLFSITDNKQLITGRRTKKQIIEESRRF